MTSKRDKCRLVGRNKPIQQRLETSWLQNSFLQRAPTGLCEEVEYNLFIYDTISLLHLDIFAVLEQGNAENKQQNKRVLQVYQESITHLQVS